MDSVEYLLSFATVSISIDQVLTPRRKFESGDVTKTKFLVRNLRGQKESDYSPRSGANFYKAGNDDVFSLFHAETD